MFGGVGDVYQVEESRLGDTWELDERGWRLVSTTGPYPWFGRGSAYDTKDRVVRKHGAGSETWEWDGSTWTNRGYHNACTTFFMAMAYDDQRSRMVLQGGFPGCPNPFYSDTYEWNGATWVFISDWGPIFQGHPGNLVYDSWRGVCVAYGAEDTFGYTYEWDGTDWHVLNPPSPPRRYAGAMAFDSRRGVTVLFGGSNNEATTCLEIPGSTMACRGVR